MDQEALISGGTKVDCSPSCNTDQGVQGYGEAKRTEKLLAEMKVKLPTSREAEDAGRPSLNQQEKGLRSSHSAAT